MNIHKMTSVAMVALAAAGLSLPATTPAVAEVNDNEVVVSVPGFYSTIADALEAELVKAPERVKTDKTKPIANKALVVKLDPLQGPYELPETIDSPYKEVRIITADLENEDRPVVYQASAHGEVKDADPYEGPGNHNDKKASLSLTPIVLDSLKVENVSGAVIEAANDVTIKNVAFEGNGTAVYARNQVDQSAHKQAANNEDRNAKYNVSTSLTVVDSSFKDVEIANINHAFKHVSIENNSYVAENTDYPNAVTLGPVSFGDGHALIAENMFTIRKNNKAAGAAVTVMRPNVTIGHNVFGGNNDQVAAVEVMIPRYKGHPVSHLVHNLQVRNNEFAMKQVFVHRTAVRALNREQLDHVINNPNVRFMNFDGNFIHSASWADSNKILSFSNAMGLEKEKEFKVGKNIWKGVEKEGKAAASK